MKFLPLGLNPNIKTSDVVGSPKPTKASLDVGIKQGINLTFNTGISIKSIPKLIIDQDARIADHPVVDPKMLSS